MILSIVSAITIGFIATLILTITETFTFKAMIITFIIPFLLNIFRKVSIITVTVAGAFWGLMAGMYIAALIVEKGGLEATIAWEKIGEKIPVTLIPDFFQPTTPEEVGQTVFLLLCGIPFLILGAIFFCRKRLAYLNERI